MHLCRWWHNKIAMEDSSQDLRRLSQTSGKQQKKSDKAESTQDENSHCAWTSLFFWVCYWRFFDPFLSSNKTVWAWFAWSSPRGETETEREWEKRVWASFFGAASDGTLGKLCIGRCTVTINVLPHEINKRRHRESEGKVNIFRAVDN